MSKFLTHARLEAYTPDEILNDGVQLWKLLDPLTYRSDLFGDITVPAGHVTDFASIPALFKRYIDDDAPGILYPSIVHDFLYLHAGQLPLPDGRAYSRELADKILREAMGATKRARADQCFVVYWIVQTFGRSHWLPAQKKPSP